MKFGDIKRQVLDLISALSLRTKVVTVAVAVVAVVALVAVVLPGGSSDSGEQASSNDPNQTQQPDSGDDPLLPREVDDLPGEGGQAVEPPAVSPVDYGPDGVDRRVLVQLAAEVDPQVLVAVGGPAAGGTVLETLDGLGNMAVIEIAAGSVAADVVQALVGFAGVQSAEPDAEVRLSSSGSQASPGSWGLNRIDQPTLPLDGVFNYPTSGAGVRAYVVDTGVRSTHVEFTGRVAAGYSVIADGRGTEECTSTDAGSYSGHGTHVAGTIAGTTYGVAKAATVVPIRVFDCAGSSSWAGIISSLNWIVANHPGGTRGVVNMSLSGGANDTADTAVNSVVAAGLPVAVAAGNENKDACTSSPARVPDALTVAASDITDTRAGFSNFGTCVDVFAPGVQIPSAFSTSDTAVNTWGGTSMAAPHVAGVAAQLLALNPAWTPAQVSTAITTAATTGTVTSPGAGSPNRVLFANPNIAANADTAMQGYHTLTNATHSFHTTPGTPAVIYKRNDSNNTVAGSLALEAGENLVGSAIISADGTAGYFAVATTPARVVKVNLTTMTRVGDVNLHASENYPHAAVINPAGTRGYFSTGDSPSKIVTVDLANMVRVSSAAVTYADGSLRSAARPLANTAVFGTNTSPGRVVRVGLGDENVFVGAILTLDSGENDLRSAVAIPNSSVVLFGTNTSPGRVVQVSVGAIAKRLSAITLAAGNNSLVGATMGSDRTTAYFSTNTSPGRIVKVPTGFTN